MTINRHCPVCGTQDQIVPGCHHTERRVSALKWTEIAHTRDASLSGLSNVLAASKIGVNAETVRTFRLRSTSENSEVGKTKGKDGRARSARRRGGKSRDSSKLSLGRPTRRRIHRPDRTLPIEKQANLITSQLFGLVEAWCKTADNFLRENPGIDQEISASMRAIAARAADRLWQCATDLLKHENDEEEAKQERNVA